MRPGDRGDGRRRGTDLFGGGFGGFPDPFGGFPGFGMLGRGGGGRSLIEDVFGHDPFDDPFFRQPFEDPFFRRPFEDPFFRRPFGGLFGQPGSLFNSGEQQSGEFLIDQRPFNPPQSGGRRGPVIEELPDDEEAPASESRPNHNEPIVEQPDDETSPGDEEDGPTRVATEYRPSQSQPHYTSRSFSYQTSTVSRPGGAYFASSTTRRAGPNGVMEEQHYEKDTLAGVEGGRVARALGDKMHAVSRKRNAEGREATLETLHNLNEEEAGQFNETWERHAESSLPGSTSRSRMLEGSRAGSSGCSQLRLPSNEGFGDETQQAKKHLKRENL